MGLYNTFGRTVMQIPSKQEVYLLSFLTRMCGIYLVAVCEFVDEAMCVASIDYNACCNALSNNCSVKEFMVSSEWHCLGDQIYYL